MSLIIAAYNESKSIAAKIENILSLDYPAEKLEVMIASDGSHDGTDAIVRRFEGPNLHLLSLPWQGKAAALTVQWLPRRRNPGLFRCQQHVRAQCHRGGRAAFRDARGGRCGGQPGLPEETEQRGLTSVGEQSYWHFDCKLKEWQSKSGNVISATGAIYAIRRRSFTRW